MLHFLHPEVGCCDIADMLLRLEIILFHFDRGVEFNIHINEWYNWTLNIVCFNG